MSSAPDLADRPLRRDAERNRQRILAAAGELFAERGLGVTLDDIARHAGVGVGTVYRRFPDKEVLIDALFEQRLEAMCAIADGGARRPRSLGRASCASSSAAASCRRATAGSRSCSRPAPTAAAASSTRATGCAGS